MCALEIRAEVVCRVGGGITYDETISRSRTEVSASHETSMKRHAAAIYRLYSWETTPAYDSASCELESRLGNSASSFCAISSSEALPSISSRVLRRRSPSSES